MSIGHILLNDLDCMKDYHRLTHVSIKCSQTIGIHYTTEVRKIVEERYKKDLEKLDYDF